MLLKAKISQKVFEFLKKKSDLKRVNEIEN